jgi:hypothetical protein
MLGVSCRGLETGVTSGGGVGEGVVLTTTATRGGDRRTASSSA